MSSSSASVGLPESWPADAVFDACPGGCPKPARRRRLEQAIGLGAGVALDVREAFSVWLSCLVLTKFEDRSDAAWFWVDQHRPTKVGLDQLVAQCVANRGAPPVLSVMSHRYVSYTYASRAFDMETVESAWGEKEWTQTLLINLRTLFKVCTERVEKWTQQRQKSGPTPTPPPVAS